MPSHSPYESAESYARGEISRNELIYRLTSWHYLPSETRTTGLHDSLLNFVPGSFDEVAAAFDDELIDEETYTLAHDALRAQNAEGG
ncbi:hypothetical protein GCM10027416_04470 [Okibacterium endophyticum]